MKLPVVLAACAVVVVVPLVASAPASAESAGSRVRTFQAGVLDGGGSIDYDHACAIVPDRTVRCWGSDLVGAVGDGTTGDANDSRDTPVTAVGVSGAASLASGASGSCAVLLTGAVECWGSDSHGLIGDGTTGDAHGVRLTASPVTGIATAVAATVGDEHACALLRTGTVSCWGDDSSGELGDGTTGDANHARLTPVPVLGVSGVAAVSADGTSTCALLGDGTVKCWGNDNHGQLGDGTTGDATHVRLAPVPVAGVSGAVAVGVGEGYACALLGDGAVRCWGSDSSGQLGDASTGDANHNRLAPVSVQGIAGATALTAGSDHACALVAGGAAQCWGSDIDGELGDNSNGDANSIRTTPVAVSGLNGAVALSASNNDTYALMADGTVRAWGYDGAGALGHGTVGSSKVPVTVYQLTAIGRISHVALATATPAQSATLGSTRQVAITVTSTSPDADAIDHVRIAVRVPHGLLLTSTNTNLGAYDPNVDVWNPTLTGSSSATLTLTLTATSAGAQSVSAAVVGADVFDPDPATSTVAVPAITVAAPVTTITCKTVKHTVKKVKSTQTTCTVSALTTASVKGLLIAKGKVTSVKAAKGKVVVKNLKKGTYVLVLDPAGKHQQVVTVKV